MACAALEARYGFDFDSVFAYSAPRSVKIRDRRLGLCFLSAQVLIAIYVLVFNIILMESYKKEGQIVGSVRLRLRAADDQFRWPPLTAPYCTGAASTSPLYQTTNGSYKFLGAGGVVAPQSACQYLDSGYAVQNPAELNAVFLPTSVWHAEESVADPAACSGFSGAAGCAFANVTPIVQTTVRDAELMTLLIDHSFASSNGVRRNSADMAGKMRAEDGSEVQPCAAYGSFASGCPSFIALGTSGKPDIVSIRTLLNAAGIASLDAASQVAPGPGGATNTSRVDGVVLLVNIIYGNFFMTSQGIPGTGRYDGEPAYTYTVSAIPNAGFKITEYSTPTGAPSMNRTRLTRAGVRIVIAQSGRIGTWDTQVFFVSITVSFGLLSVASLIVNFVAFNCCKYRAIYKQYAMRETVDFSAMEDTLGAQSVLAQFKTEQNLIDPVPPIFAAVYAADEEKGGTRAARASDAWRRRQGRASAASTSPLNAAATAIGISTSRKSAAGIAMAELSEVGTPGSGGDDTRPSYVPVAQHPTAASSRGGAEGAFHAVNPLSAAKV